MTNSGQKLEVEAYVLKRSNVCTDVLVLRIRARKYDTC